MSALHKTQRPADDGPKAQSKKQRNVKTTVKAPTTQLMVRPWRDVLPVHPAADAYPLMPPDELKDLAEDIKKNGLKSKLTTWMDPKTNQWLLVDGRNRADALTLLGTSFLNCDMPDLAYFEPALRIPAEDIEVFARSKNVFRRHLTPEQRRERIADAIKANPEKSNRSLAKELDVDHKTIGKIRAEQAKVGSIPHHEKRIGADGVTQSATKTVSLTIRRGPDETVEAPLWCDLPDPRSDRAKREEKRKALANLSPTDKAKRMANLYKPELTSVLTDEHMAGVFGRYEPAHVAQLITYAFRNRVPTPMRERLLEQLAGDP